MKVRELVDRLHQFDPNLDLVFCADRQLLYGVKPNVQIALTAHDSEYVYYRQETNEEWYDEELVPCISIDLDGDL
mgnify:CR=1 FL=1